MCVRVCNHVTLIYTLSYHPRVCATACYFVVGCAGGGGGGGDGDVCVHACNHLALLYLLLYTLLYSLLYHPRVCATACYFLILQQINIYTK